MTLYLPFHQEDSLGYRYVNFVALVQYVGWMLSLTIIITYKNSKWNKSIIHPLLRSELSFLCLAIIAGVSSSFVIGVVIGRRQHGRALSSHCSMQCSAIHGSIIPSSWSWPEHQCILLLTSISESFRQDQHHNSSTSPKAKQQISLASIALSYW